MKVTGTGSDGVLTDGFNLGFFGVFPLFYDMVGCQNGVSCKHSRTGVAHNFPNAFTHCGFIAMYAALGTGTLFGSERTFVDLPEGILQQFFTIQTQRTARGGMTAMAINPYHGRYSLFSRSKPLCPRVMSGVSDFGFFLSIIGAIRKTVWPNP
jgi:hypothetical protein